MLTGNQDKAKEGSYEDGKRLGPQTSITDRPK